MAFRAANSVAASSNTISVTKPTGTAADDILIFCITIDSAESSFTWPSGFTALHENRLGTDGQLTGIAWKRAGGSEPATYDASVASSYSDGDHTATVAAFSGRNVTDPPVAATASVSDTGNASPVSAASNAVTAVAGDDLFHCGLMDPTGSATTLTQAPHSGWTEITEQAQDWAAHGASYIDNVSAGSTGAITAVMTMNNSSAYVAHLVRIPAAAGGGGGDPEIALIRGGKLVGGGLLLKGGLRG